MKTARRIPRPFFATGLAAATLAGVANVCTATLANAQPLLQAAGLL